MSGERVLLCSRLTGSCAFMYARAMSPPMTATSATPMVKTGATTVTRTSLRSIDVVSSRSLSRNVDICPSTERIERGKLDVQYKTTGRHALAPMSPVHRDMIREVGVVSSHLGDRT